MMLDAASRTVDMFDDEEAPVTERRPTVPTLRALRRRFNKVALQYCGGLAEYSDVMAAYNEIRERVGS